MSMINVLAYILGIIMYLVKDAIAGMNGVELKRKDHMINTLFLSTEKAKEWEQKRENYKQIKFIEDFNEILNEVEGDE